MRAHDLTIECPECNALHEVTMYHSRPEASVGYGGGWEVDEAPEVCDVPGNGEECAGYHDGDRCRRRAVYDARLSPRCAPVDVQQLMCAECVWSETAWGVCAVSVRPLPPCGYVFTDRDRDRWEDEAAERARDDYEAAMEAKAEAQAEMLAERRNRWER